MALGEGPEHLGRPAARAAFSVPSATRRPQAQAWARVSPQMANPQRRFAPSAAPFTIAIPVQFVLR